MILKEDTIECWYYLSEEEAERNDVQVAVGYTRVEMGVLKDHWGIDTQYCHLKSKTIVSDDVRKKKIRTKRGKRTVFAEIPAPEAPELAPGLTPTSNTNAMPYFHNEDQEIAEILDATEDD